MRWIATLLLGAIFLAVLCAGWIAPYDSDVQVRDDAGAAPSRHHLLGADALGRDRLSRILYGGRISLLAAPAAAILAVALALAAGLTIGCLGGWWERAFACLVDLCLSLPWLFLLLAVRALLPLNVSPTASIAVTFALLGLLGWAGPSRILLSAAKGHLASDFTLTARAAGCSTWRVAIIQILPNLLPLAIAQFLIAAPAFLLSEANLAMLGLGVAEPAPSWGNLLRELEDFSRIPSHPWVAAPLVALVVVVTCFHVAATGYRERV